MDGGQFKLALLGDSGVGKSSLVARLVHGEFNVYREPTIGAAYVSTSMYFENYGDVKLQIWDTAGQERFQSLSNLYYRSAVGALVVFDITDRESFNKAKTWVSELRVKGDPNVSIGLVGNKTDLESKREVEYETAEAYAKKSSIFYRETSAKTNENVREVFEQLTRRILKTQLSVKKGSDKSKKIDDLSNSKNQGGCC